VTHARPESIRLLTLDVDGVLTDGMIRIDDDGRETKCFHVRDGAGLHLWRRSGRHLAIITGRQSRVVTHRAAELKIDLVYQKCRDKSAAWREVLARTGVSEAQTAHMGDDLADLALLRRVAYPITVADAPLRVKKAAAYVTHAAGGHGAVRDAVEHLLREAGELEALEAEYEQR
jgi:3-deoxy-D-manno-octulosonate 8-phosphate phosphatase (KDO 8-P phosphatase)